MRIRSFRESDFAAAAAVFARGPGLFERSPHILDERADGPAAKALLRRTREEGRLSPDGVLVAEEQGRIIGVVSAGSGKEPECGEIRWLAVEERPDLREVAADLVRSVERLPITSGHRRVTVSAWAGQSHQPLLLALGDAGFTAKSTSGDGILMGCRLRSLPSLPSLPEGYDYHTYRPGDEVRWVLTKNRIFETREPMDAFEKYYSGRPTFDPDEVVFVEHGGDLVAICAGIDDFKHFEGQQFSVAYLDWVGALPAHRGKGLGEFVCVYCMRYLKRRGVTYCTLVTQPVRVPAVRLYKKLGFEQIAAAVAFEKVTAS